MNPTVTIPVVFLADNQIWWEAPNSLRIPTAIVVPSSWASGIDGVYRSSRNTPKPAPKVRRIERIAAISLGSFIAVRCHLLLFKH
jgi:hypothetical protein